MRIFCIFSFLSILDTLSLVHWSCDHLTYIVLIFGLYIFWCMFFHLSLHMLFLLSLYTHVSYFLYAILYFCFTLRCLDEFCLKCFRNTSCQSLLAITLFLQSFSKVCIRIDFIVFHKVCCGFVTDCQRGRLLGHMWFNVRNICHYFI